jgi:hypothetical protein
MLPLFEIETRPLTEIEKTLLPIIAGGLSTRIGAHKAMTNEVICEKVFVKYNVKLSEARLRKIINYIRMTDMLPGLMATSRGYYITTNPEELKKWIDSLDGRERAINGIKTKAEKYLFELTQQPQQSSYTK